MPRRCRWFRTRTSPTLRRRTRVCSQNVISSIFQVLSRDCGDVNQIVNDVLVRVFLTSEGHVNGCAEDVIQLGAQSFGYTQRSLLPPLQDLVDLLPSDRKFIDV